VQTVDTGPVIPVEARQLFAIELTFVVIAVGIPSTIKPLMGMALPVTKERV
jgi:hypothetical protein